MPPEISPFPAPDALRSGDEISLNCNAYKGDTPMTISWTFHGEDVAMDREFTTQAFGGRTRMLLIKSVAYGHSGTYTCRAENAAGVSTYSTRLVVKGQLTAIALFHRLFFVSLSFSEAPCFLSCADPDFSRPPPSLHFQVFG